MTTQTARAQKTRTDRALVAFATLLIVTLLAGDFWRNLLSWGGFAVLAGLLTIGSVVWIVVLKPTVKFRKIPKSLMLFLAFATVSIAWSFYAGASALGLAATWAATAAGAFLALCLTWQQVLHSLGNALRWILGLSILFELIVSIFVRHPILPIWPILANGDSNLPQAFYWSRDLLFKGGQIQGIIGNSNLLAMCALFALIVFGIQLADRTVKRGWGIAWLLLAIVTFVLTRSSTVIIATVLTALVLLLALWTRRRPAESRAPVYGSAFAAIVVGAVAIVLLWAPILKLFGKSEDLTGRLTIWKAVTDLAVQRPVFGWGWVGYWVPWVKLFHDLAERKGVVYLQAHDAWLDVWMQLGIIGLIIFIVLVASTLGRSWFAAVDRPRASVIDDQPFTALGLLPLLLIAALIAQSAAESRILVEGGLALLVMITLKTKADRP